MRRQLLQDGDGGVPADAGIGDALTEDEVIDVPDFEFLASRDEETLEHHSAMPCSPSASRWARLATTSGWTRWSLPLLAWLASMITRLGSP